MAAPKLHYRKKYTIRPWISLDGYEIIEKIGSGSYSTVYKAFVRGTYNDVVAIKCVEKCKLSSSGMDNIITEISMMKMLKHQYIVKMIEFLWDDRLIYIVMEYCDGGDLSHFIQKRRTLSEYICQRFMQQLAEALKFLRSHNICHLDLKPQNLLLVTDPALTLKVADFGFAQFLSNETYQCTLRGSPLYMAPEMLIKRHYDAKVDLWSVGVIAYECLFGKAPYSSNNIIELQEKIRNNVSIEIPLDSEVSQECRDLLKRLLKHNPDDRIDYEDFFHHPFLDMDHIPSPDGYSKAVELVNLAVKHDICKEYKEAFLKYCEALRYLVPLVMGEVNIAKRNAFRIKVSEYMKRAEELKGVLNPDKLDTPSVKFISGMSTSVKSSSVKSTSIRSTSVKSSSVKSSLFKSSFGKSTSAKTSSVPTSDREVTSYNSSSLESTNLRTLSMATPNMLAGVDIGFTAQMYLAEGQYKLALDKFEKCLGILVPMLATEPNGQRKELLYEQIEDWLKQAESTKAFLQYKNMNQDSTPQEDTAGNHNKRTNLCIRRIFVKFLDSRNKNKNK